MVMFFKMVDLASTASSASLESNFQWNSYLMKTIVRDSIWKPAELWVLAQIMRHAPIPTLQEPVRQNISIVLKHCCLQGPERQKGQRKMKLPQRGRRDAISALRNVIAKPNRLATDVTIIFIKNPRASLAFTAKSATTFTFCRKLWFVIMNANFTLLVRKIWKQYCWLDNMYHRHHQVPDLEQTLATMPLQTSPNMYTLS